MTLPSKEEQIVKAHGALIYNVAQASKQKELLAHLAPMLDFYRQQGWEKLVLVINKILNGSRDAALLSGLDEEDGAIVKAILLGIQDPNTLPDPNPKPDPTLAAPGLASMVHAASTGDPQALQALALMAEQMTQIGGDMARLGGIMGRFVRGERDPDILSKGMGNLGKSLVLSILAELAKLTTH